MKCKHCGAKNPDNAIFCGSCQQWILSEVNAERKKPAYRKSKIAVLAQRMLLAVVCLCLVIGAAFAFRRQNDPQLNTSLPTPNTTPPVTLPPVDDPFADYVQCGGSAITQRIDDNIHFVLDNSMLPTDIPMDSITSSIAYSLDRRSIAFTADGVLYCIHGGVLQKIAQNVTSFALSASGNGIAYYNHAGQLWHYYDDQKTLIRTDELDRIFYLAISPDGTCVAYTTQHIVIPTGYDSGQALVLYHNNSTQILGSLNGSIIAVSDGGWVYVKEPTVKGSLLSIIGSQGNRTELGYLTTIIYTENAFTSEINFSTELAFNADHRQVLYYTKEGTYLSIDGQAGQKISDTYLTPVLPEMTAKLYSLTHSTCPILDLRDKLYTTTVVVSDAFISSSLWPVFRFAEVFYLSEDMQTSTVITNAKEIWLDPSGTILYCLNDKGMLYQITQWDTIACSSSCIATDVSKFAVSNDCSQVYYQTSDRLYRSEDGAITLLASELGNNAALYCTVDGTFCFYENGTLWIQINGLHAYTTQDSPYMGHNRRLYLLGNNSIQQVKDGNIFSF